MIKIDSDRVANRPLVGLCNYCNNPIFYYVTPGVPLSMVVKDKKKYHKACLDKLEKE